ISWTSRTRISSLMRGPSFGAGCAGLIGRRMALLSSCRCNGLLPQVPKGSVQNGHKSTANRGTRRPFPYSGRCFLPRAGSDLVSRFRSSHHYAARSLANFGIEGHWQLIDLVWLWFRSPHFGLAAEMMRTSEPPHHDAATARSRYCVARQYNAGAGRLSQPRAMRVQLAAWREDLTRLCNANLVHKSILQNWVWKRGSVRMPRDAFV